MSLCICVYLCNVISSCIVFQYIDVGLLMDLSRFIEEECMTNECSVE